MRSLRCTAVALAGALLLTGCGLLPREAELKQTPVAQEVSDAQYAMASVRRGDLAVTRSLRFTYRPARSETLFFSTGGERIRSVYVQVGDTVKEGDLLAELDAEALQDQKTTAEWELARLRLELSQTEEQKDIAMRRAEILVSQAGTSLSRADALQNQESVEAQYDEQLTALEDEIYIQEQKLEAIQADIESRLLFAPISGSVTMAKTLEEGSFSDPKEAVITIADMESSVFVATGEDATFLSVGDTVLIEYDGAEHAAMVADPSALGLEAGRETAYLSLETPDPTLTEGTSGTVTKVLEQANNVLYVPSNAVKRRGGETGVYVLDAEGMKQWRPVTVGLDTGELVEIREGLGEGEELIDE